MKVYDTEDKPLAAGSQEVLLTPNKSCAMIAAEATRSRAMTLALEAGEDRKPPRKSSVYMVDANPRWKDKKAWEFARR